jgi:hypothetical protein
LIEKQYFVSAKTAQKQGSTVVSEEMCSFTAFRYVRCIYTCLLETQYTNQNLPMIVSAVNWFVGTRHEKNCRIFVFHNLISAVHVVRCVLEKLDRTSMQISVIIEFNQPQLTVVINSSSKHFQFLVGAPEGKRICQSQVSIVKGIFSQCRVVYPWANSRSTSFITCYFSLV